MIFETAVVPIIWKIILGHTEEPQNLSGLSVLRMLRLLRLTKGLRMVPQLMCLVQGVVKAIVPMFYTGIMLFLLVYVFAVIFRSQAKGMTGTSDPYIHEMFRSVTESLFTLLLF